MREIIKTISIPVEGKPLDFRHVCLVSWLNAIGDGSARYAARRNCRTVPDVPQIPYKQVSRPTGIFIYAVDILALIQSIFLSVLLYPIGFQCFPHRRLNAS